MRPEPEPLENPPPCSQTITGRLRPSFKPGVKTFRTRHSSLCCAGDPAAVVPELSLVCGAVGPNASASRVPVHGDGLTGGLKRLRPLVGAPYGTPLKILTPSTATPRILPADVSAIASGSAAAINFAHGTRGAPATRSEACFTNARRLETCAISRLLSSVVGGRLPQYSLVIVPRESIA